MATVSLSAIVRDYRENKLESEFATDWGSVVFYRAPAFVLAWMLAPLGVTPNQVTVAGALLIPVMALCAWWLPPATAIVTVMLLGFAFNVLDCTDGVLARNLNLGSVTGRYLDFASDILYRLVAYGCFGLIADRTWPGAAFPWVAVGLCCGLLGLYARVNRIFGDDMALEETPPAKPAETPAATQPAEQPAARRRSPFEIAFSFLSGMDTLMPLIAFVAWEAGVLREALVWFVLYTAGDSIVEVLTVYFRARNIDVLIADSENSRKG